MRILAIETSGAFASLALAEEAGLLGERTYLAKKTTCSTIASEIQQLLASTGSASRCLAAIAVSQGPGSFTSLRVGVATANALAQALKIPLIGIPTLQVVAASTSLPPAASIIAASPSKRSELYLQHWTNVPPWESQSPIVPVLIAHLASHLEAYGFPFLVGESAQTWLVEAGSPPSVPLDIPPRASSLAKLALDSLLASDPSTLIPPPYLVPFYIRLSQPEEKSPT